MGNYQYIKQPTYPNEQVQNAVPQQTYIQQPIMPQPNPTQSASGVNISIQNPMASTAPIQPTGYGYAYPANYYVQQPIYNTYPNNAPPAAPAGNINADVSAATSVSDTKDAKKADDKKEIVQITDDYVKTLENYLRNPGKDVRIMGAKELLTRFKEEKTRKTDASLNSLLNLTLQDPSADIRALGLTILNSGYAGGDNNTVQLLKNMQKSELAYGQDALSASQALLKMSGELVEVTDNSHDKNKNTKKDKNE